MRARLAEDAMLARDFEPQLRVSARGRNFRLDFALREHKVAIEFDGEGRAALVKFDVPDELGAFLRLDEYFVSRSLYPNVDFYTGLIYQAMGFPTKMFTPLFALGRLPGWIAQYREMINDENTKIGRPRQIYTGSEQRDYPTA